MNLRPVTNPGPMIACALAMAAAQDRLRANEPPPPPRPPPEPAPSHSRFPDLTQAELAEARTLARSYRYPFHEAVEIVRRSRR